MRSFRIFTSILVFTLFIKALSPLAHARLLLDQSLLSGLGSVTICTPFGLQTLSVDENGDMVEAVDVKCPYCNITPAIKCDSNGGDLSEFSIGEYRWEPTFELVSHRADIDFAEHLFSRAPPRIFSI